MDKRQTLLFIELRECRKEYLTVAKKYRKGTALKKLYEKWDEWYLKGAVSKIGYINALDNSVASRKAVKINPYVAGGAGQALGGAGLGAYSAIKADQRNKEIDQSRHDTYIAAREAEANDKMSERELWSICESILKLLNTMPETKKIREEFLDKLYNEANRLALQGKYDEAIKKFDLLNGYRDSEQRVSSLKSKKTNGKLKLVFICSVLLSFFLVVFSGVISAGFEAVFIVFIFAFVISFIWLLFTMK